MIWWQYMICDFYLTYNLFYETCIDHKFNRIPIDFQKCWSKVLSTGKLPFLYNVLFILFFLKGWLYAIRQCTFSYVLQMKVFWGSRLTWFKRSFWFSAITHVVASWELKIGRVWIRKPVASFCRASITLPDNLSWPLLV